MLALSERDIGYLAITMGFNLASLYFHSLSQNKENVRLQHTEQVMLKLKDDLGDLEKVKAESKELNKTVVNQETELEKLRRLLEETQTEKGLVEEELQSVIKARAEVCAWAHYIVFIL